MYLSMTTSKATTQNHIQPTLFAVDSLAKTSQLQDKAKVSPKKLGQVSFTNSCESFAWFDPNTSSWRTWQRSLITDWELYSESWPRQGSIVNGRAYLQVHWEPVIKETDGGSSDILPTPNTMDHLPQRSPEALKKQMEGPRKGRTKLANLREAVNPETQRLFNSMLPTPRAAKGMEMRLSKNMAKLEHKKYLETEMAARMHTHGETHLTNSKEIGENGVLNPSFVEEMMGYPIGYTDLKH